MSKKKLIYDMDCWEGIEQRTFKSAFAEFAVQIVSHLPRGLKHNSIFNKIRTYIIKLSGVKVGVGSYFYPGVTIVKPENLNIGNDTFLNYNCLISCYDKVHIGSRVSISYNVKIITETHDYEDKNFQAEIRPVIIEDNVWIGAGTIILPGVTIGEGSVVAAGSVVKNDIPAWSIAGGVPAKIIKERIIKT